MDLDLNYILRVAQEMGIDVKESSSPQTCIVDSGGDKIEIDKQTLKDLFGVVDSPKWNEDDFKKNKLQLTYIKKYGIINI